MVMHAEIKPDCFYDQLALRRILELSTVAINRACRDGSLKCKVLSGERLFKGSWVIEWLESQPEDERHEAAHSNA